MESGRGFESALDRRRKQQLHDSCPSTRSPPPSALQKLCACVHEDTSLHLTVTQPQHLELVLSTPHSRLRRSVEVIWLLLQPMRAHVSYPK